MRGASLFAMCWLAAMCGFGAIAMAGLALARLVPIIGLWPTRIVLFAIGATAIAAVFTVGRDDQAA